MSVLKPDFQRPLAALWCVAVWGVIGVCGALACGAARAENDTQREPDAGAQEPEREHTPGCGPPAGVSNAPLSIAETVALVNAMPKPLTLPCFLEALSRPLQISATDSVISMQPAQGKRSPRIFLLRSPNTMSIVPTGVGASLLEFGEERPNYRSLKAEIEFPVLALLSPSAPFDNLLYDQQLSNCGVCHGAEAVESTVDGIRRFTSQSFRPITRDLVSAAALGNELATCDSAAEPERCAMLDGLMGWGTVTDGSFPPEMATFGTD